MIKDLIVPQKFMIYFTGTACIYLYVLDTLLLPANVNLDLNLNN